MYLGRIVAIGMTRSGRAAAMYRVSSRSFPNREARVKGEIVSIMPRAGFEGDLAKNPYIAYNALKIVRGYVVVSNGSQTDPIVEKIAMGYPVRDAFALGLLAMDYEKDSLDTPRIVGAVSQSEKRGFLGIVRKDALLVREFALVPGRLNYVSTYECNRPADENLDEAFDGACVNCVAQYAVDGGVFAGFEHPVTSCAALAQLDCECYDIGTVIVPAK
ncbi:MAG: IMP cyclohydrolase [Victivallaceae bacterium]|nr:IMP cyclohydrolase [Victivallaceae bacterium]